MRQQDTHAEKRSETKKKRGGNMGGGRFVYVTGEMTVNLLRPRRSAAGERAVWSRWRPTLNNNLLQGCSQSAPGSHTKKHPVQRKVGAGGWGGGSTVQ